MTTRLDNLNISGSGVGPNPQDHKLDDHLPTDTQRGCQDGADGALLRDRTQSKRGGERNEMNNVQQGRGSGYNDFQASAFQNVELKPVAPLRMSANRWDRRAMPIDPDSPVFVDRKVTALLNKLTMQKFDSISDQVIAWANKSEKEKDGRTLVQVIRLVFEKAIDEAIWSEMYARLWRKMMEQISSKVQDHGIKSLDGKPIAGGQLFRKYMLNRCQKDFERGWVAKEATAAAAAVKASRDEAAKAVIRQSKEGGTEKVALYSDEYYAAQKAKRQGLGLIKFIGEFFKLQMLTERIMHECVKKLLGNVENPEEEEIESLCTLLTTVGASFDTPRARAHMEVYFSRMKELSKNQNVSLRMQFMLQDMIELRERKWESRNAVAARAAERALKSRHNSLAAISRLPPEILSKIFICCAATYEPSIHWVKVTHVTRHWRTVAIGCPRLWTTLIFSRPRWVGEMLKRSKMAPLVIDAEYGSYMGSKTTEAIQLAMNHISRVRELSIDSQPESASFGNVFSSVPRAAPMLRTLVLSAPTNHYADPFHDNYSIPPELFIDDSSQLRRLELTHCNLDWTSHLLKGLTYLKVHKPASGSRPSTHLFLDVLEQLPTLTVLDLDDALPHVGDGSSASYQRNVKLRSLTNFHLAGSASDCSNALRQLSVPSGATLKLSCRSTVVSDADLSSILTFVNGLWEPTPIVSSAAEPHRCPIHSLKIWDVGLTAWAQGVGSTGLSFQAWPTVLTFPTLSGDPDPLPFIDLFFQWSSTVTPGIGDKVIGETCAALPLEQLASLYVSSQVTEQTLLRTFGKLTHLRSIHAEGLAAPTLLSAMIAEPSTTATSANVSANLSTWKRSRNRREMPLAVYFPSLLHLTIEDTDFDYDKLEALKNCLVERYERKAEVRELTLSRCRRLTTELVDELREIVADVIWDGWDDYGDDIDDRLYHDFDSDGDDIDYRSGEPGYWEWRGECLY